MICCLNNPPPRFIVPTVMFSPVGNIAYRTVYARLFSFTYDKSLFSWYKVSGTKCFISQAFHANQAWSEVASMAFRFTGKKMPTAYKKWTSALPVSYMVFMASVLVKLNTWNEETCEYLNRWCKRRDDISTLAGDSKRGTIYLSYQQFSTPRGLRNKLEQWLKYSEKYILIICRSRFIKLWPKLGSSVNSKDDHRLIPAFETITYIKNKTFLEISRNETNY